jgi:hypothetical protein
MMDSNLDLRIPPVIRCRTCGERVEIIYVLMVWIAEALA